MRTRVTRVAAKSVMNDESRTITVDEEMYQALLRLAVAAGALGNRIEPEPNCHCPECEFARAWQVFAKDPEVMGFVERKLAVEAVTRLLRS